MNRSTRSMSGLLAFLAICFAPKLMFGCGINVSLPPGQQVSVTILLDPQTGMNTLSGSNIAAFVQGTGGGACNTHHFYATTSLSSYIGTTVDYSCGDVQPGAQVIYVRMWDGTPGAESSPVAVQVFVQDQAPPLLICPANVTFLTDDDGVSDCEATADPALKNQIKLDEKVAPDFADDPGEASDNCGISQFLFSKNGSAAAAFNPANPTALFPFSVGAHNLVYTVKDAQNNTATCPFTVTVQDVEPPVLVGAFADDTIDCGDAVPVPSITASDNCSGATIAFSQASGQDPDSTVCAHYTYLITQTWTATDASGNQTTDSRQILVQDTIAPSVNLPATMLVMTAPFAASCAAAVSLFLTDGLIDDCAADSLLAISNDAPFGNGREDASGNYPPGQYVIHFYVEDPCQNVDTSEITLTVLDGTSPVVSCQTSINVALNNQGMASIGLFQVLAGLPSDNCTSQNDLLNSAVVSPTDFTCSNIAAPVTVSLTVTDGAGNSTTCTTQVFTQDNTAPTIACPADVTFSCAVDSAGIGSPTISDACTQNIVPTFVETTISSGPNCFVTTRIWSAADASGNSAHCAQSITVEDNLAPTFSGVPAEAVLNCGSALPAASVTAMDDCAGLVGVTVHLDTTDFDCSIDLFNGHPLRYAVTRTWEASDACGNDAFVSQTIYFIDTIAPDLSAVPASLIFYAAPNVCSADVVLNLNNYAITDNCGSFTTSGSMNAPGTLVGTMIRAISATDQCGNVANGSVILEVKDSVSPQLICQSEITVVLTNAGFATIDESDVVISANDACSATAISLSFDEVSCADASLESLGFGAPILYVTATDASGNEAECAVEVHVNAPAGLGIEIQNVATTDPTFFGGQDGTATIGTVTGGSGNYTYAFFDQFFFDLGIGQAIDSLGSGFFWAGVQDLNTTCIDLYPFILDEGPAPFFYVDSIDGAAGDTLLLAVSVEAFKNVRSVQMQLDVLDPSVGQVLSVENAQPGLFLLAAGSGNSPIISIMSIDTISDNLNDGDVLFYLKVKLTGGLGDTTSAIIVNGSIEVVTDLNTTIPAGHEDGFIAVTSGLPDSEIAGRIWPWWNPNTGIAQVAVNLNAGQNSFTTNATGFFSFIESTGQGVSITPTKNINWANGVTSFDLSRIQSWILGDPSVVFNPYQQIAADATRDNKISTFDLVNLQYIILNPTASLPNNKSWRFIPSNFALPSSVFALPFVPFAESRSFILSQDSLENDFVAVKIGDVNGSANPLNVGPDAPVLDRSPLLFSVENRAIKAGETVKIPLTARGFLGQKGWQMTLGWDAQQLDFQRVTSVSALGLNESNFGKGSTEEGQLTAAWFAAEATDLADGSPLFEVEFLVKKAAPSLEGLLEINSSITPALAHDGKSETGLLLLFAEKGQISQPAPTLDRLQIRPNPMTDFSEIEYIVPTGDAAETVNWAIFDATGRTVKAASEKAEKGRTTIRLDRSDLPQAGTYFFEIRSAAGVRRQQIVVVD